MNVYTMTVEQLGAFANRVKDVISDQLKKPELDEYFIVIQERSWFGKMFAKLKGKQDTLLLIVTKPPESKVIHHVWDEGDDIKTRIPDAT